MKFSFVIPAYNEEGYLEGCLRSIKGQGKKNYEIIVSYSDSKDNTRKIAEDYGARVVNVPRSSPAVARNAGAKKARGDYLVFIDADAELPHNFLKSTEIMLSGGATAVGYSFRSLEKDWMIDGIHTRIMNPAFRRMKLFYGCYTVKKSAFRKVGGFRNTNDASEDVDLAKKISRIGTIVFAPDVVLKISSRRIYKMGKLRTIYVYLLGGIKTFLGLRVRYDHMDDL